jgi:predicted esterase
MTKAQCEKQCSGPAPGPAPTPNSGTWANYKVAGMDVLSVTGTGKIEKVIVMLHGGGGEGTDWKIQYDLGWFGDTSGLKYVFPSSPDKLWYESTKQAGCGFCDDCAYVAGSIETSATRIATLIQHELPNIGNVTTKMYVAGFSEGAQLTAYMQIAKLNFPLGGTIVMDGYALPPVCDAKTVASKATYSGQDMNWFLYWGGEDPIFPPQESLDVYHAMLSALNVSSTLTYEHTEPGMSHTLIQKEFTEMVAFIRK